MQFRKLFGSYNLGQMIETSYLSVSAIFISEEGNSNQNNQLLPRETLMGFAIVSDTPRSGLSEDWLGWFSETHAPADVEVTMTNTLWVDFAVAVGAEAAAGRAGEDHGGKDEEAAGVIEDIVRTVFNTLPEVSTLNNPSETNSGAEKGWFEKQVARDETEHTVG